MNRIKIKKIQIESLFRQNKHIGESIAQVAEKLNEVIDFDNGRFVFEISEDKELKLKDFLRDVLKPESRKEPYISNIIHRILGLLEEEPSVKRID